MKNQESRLQGTLAVLCVLGLIGCGLEVKEDAGGSSAAQFQTRQAALNGWAQVPIPEANFSTQSLDATYPSGAVILGGVPFYIPTGNNTWHADVAAGGGAASVSLDLTPDIVGATEVHTLINTYWGQKKDPYASIEFWGSAGANYKHSFIGGTGVRDYLQNHWTNTIDGEGTVNVFNTPNRLMRLDKQRIVLPSAFAKQTLTRIRLTDTGHREFQRVFLAGLTVKTTGSVTSNCLSDYNLFLLGNYSGGHDVQGKVAAGGSITMTDFSVGAGLADNHTAHSLVAGGNLSLSRGGVWGDASYGGSYTSDPSVTFVRGTASQGKPIDFVTRGIELRRLSSQLAGLATTGTTTRESWGGIKLRGTDPGMNVFAVNASAFTGAKLLSIEAPAGSLAVINIRGGAATFTGFGQSFSGGIDQHGVLFNFVDATSINAHGYGFWGTVLAPYAQISFNDGSFDGGIYALSLTGNAEGHINALRDSSICQLLSAAP